MIIYLIYYDGLFAARLSRCRKARRLIGLFEVGAVVAGSGIHIRTVNIGTVNIGTVNIGTVDIGTVNVGTVDIGTVNIRTVNIRTVNIRTVNIRTVWAVEVVVIARARADDNRAIRADRADIRWIIGIRLPIAIAAAAADVY
ncbi:pentapeptide repeat-containing protein [Stenoxybacter acetivorans]|uniref:pentapeptide repeat-containing protein n=1 Tax=Stenoxybacter acetivorans TaxID=422441 RepID=UPI00147056F5